jgi:hypothetical protein
VPGKIAPVGSAASRGRRVRAKAKMAEAQRLRYHSQMFTSGFGHAGDPQHVTERRAATATDGYR